MDVEKEVTDADVERRTRTQNKSWLNWLSKKALHTKRHRLSLVPSTVLNLTVKGENLTWTWFRSIHPWLWRPIGWTLSWRNCWCSWVTFPEDYQAEDLAGKEAKFVTTIHEVSKEVPALDDELAKDTMKKWETWRMKENTAKNWLLRKKKHTKMLLKVQHR